MSLELDSDGKADLIRSVLADWPEHRTFIETGSAQGDLSVRLTEHFDQILTVEARRDNYESTVRRTLELGNVVAIHGDSAAWIADMLAVAATPPIMWLDAHEVRPAGNSALRGEMEALHRAGLDGGAVVLVDDLRLCRGKNGWPTIDELTRWARTVGLTLGYAHPDVAVLTPTGRSTPCAAS